MVVRKPLPRNSLFGYHLAHICEPDGNVGLGRHGTAVDAGGLRKGLPPSWTARTPASAGGLHATLKAECERTMPAPAGNGGPPDRPDL
jgi:hypothetical protein